MNNTLRYALTMVFAGASLPMVFAQATSESEAKHEENSKATEVPATSTHHEEQIASSPSFPDSPENHWAFEALGNLKKHGVLQGYPDGLFRGHRVPTRYEMAYAVNAAYTKLMSLYDGLQGQVKALDDSINGAGNAGADLKALRDQLAAHQGSLDSMKTYGDDLANLKKMADAFKDDLSKMGVDVAALKKDLSTLEARVTQLEKRRHTIDFRGDVNVVGLYGFSKSGSAPGITQDGRLVGTNKNVNPGLGSDALFYHELGLTMTSTNETGPVFRGTLVAGNFLSDNSFGQPTGFGNQSQRSALKAFDEKKADVYIQDLSVKFEDWKLGSIRLEAEFGRLGYQGSSHLFKRGTSNYLLNNNPRWNSGNYTIDGALLKFKFGKDDNAAQLHFIGGRNKNVTSVNGIKINSVNFSTNPMNKGAFLNEEVFPELVPNALDYLAAKSNLTVSNNLLINQKNFEARETFGARLYVPFGKLGEANLTGMLFQTNRETIANVFTSRVAVYGADVKFNLAKGFTVKGAYGKTPFISGKKQSFNQDNDYMSGELGFDTGRFGITGGYRQIKDNYIAPGSWNENSFFGNATGVRGFIGHAYFNATPKINIGLCAKIENSVKLVGTVRPKYMTFGGHLKYALSDQLDVCLRGERIQVDQKFTPKATFNWVTLSAGYRVGSANFSGGFQYGQHTNLKDNFPALSLASPLGNASKGGQAFAHVIYHF